MSMLFSSKSSCKYNQYQSTTNTSPMANAFNFKILNFAILKGDDYIALRVHYPDATEFNGIKIMIYKKELYNWLKQTNKLDPHFLNNNTSPIARFPGNDIGWDMALNFTKENSE